MPRVTRRPKTSSTAVNPANRRATVHELQSIFTREFRQGVMCGLEARKAGHVRPRKSHGPPKQAGHIKRPPNSFLVFRSEVCDEKDTGGPQQALSRLAADLWHMLAMDDPIRLLCEEIAAEEARKHREENPGYKYAPRRPPSRPVAAPKPKSRWRKKAAGAADEDDYVDGDEQHPIAARPTLRARSNGRALVEYDFENEDDSEGMAAQSEVGSVSSDTVVGNDSDSDRETTVTAPASPSPAASSPSPSTPATAVLPDDSGEIFVFKTEPSSPSNAGTPAFSFSLEGSSTPCPHREIKDESIDPALVALRPGCSPGTSLLASECSNDSYWSQQLDSSESDVYGSTVKLEDDLNAFIFVSQTDSASSYESELASAAASGPWDLTRDLEDLKPLQFASEEFSDTTMEIHPDILSDPCIPMDVDMDHYLAWGIN